jgi:hypothetical protein
VLERSLNAPYVVGSSSYIDIFVLGVLDWQTLPVSLVPVFPSPFFLEKVTRTNADADILVVEQSAVQFKKI